MAERLRVASVNLNKRMSRQATRQKILDWLARHDVDLLITQEPWVSGNPFPEGLPGYGTLGGNDLVHAWCRVSITDARADLLGPTFLVVRARGWMIVDCYLDSSNKRAIRAGQMATMRAWLEQHGSAPLLVAGDFNLAPAPEDGLWKGAPSAWNGAVDRGELQRLLDETSMVDLGAPPTPREWTFVRSNKHGVTEFRCDLALVSRVAAGSTALRYDHGTRSGRGAFTDHSGLVIDLEAAAP